MAKTQAISKNKNKDMTNGRDIIQVNKIQFGKESDTEKKKASEE